MKTTIQHQSISKRMTGHSLRIGHLRSIRIMMSLALLALAITGAGQSAWATTTFSYSGSHTLTWTSNGSKDIYIERTGGYDSITVFASVSGSSKFTPQFSSVWWPDTAADTNWQSDTARGFMISFNSAANDTSYAKLVLYDNNHSDTISLVGYGTSDSIDFTIGSTSMNITVNRDTGATTASALDEVLNHRSSTITVFPQLVDSAYWSIDIDSAGATSIVLAGYAWREPAIVYHSHGVWRDSTAVVYTCFSPYFEQRTVEVYVTDPLYAPNTYAPAIRVPDIIAQFGDTGCGSATIRDTTSEPITITAITKSSQTGWSLSGLPSLPVTLAPGDSITFSVCFGNGNSYVGPSSTVGITASYTDTSGVTGEVLGVSYASYSGSCLESLRSDADTLKMDEVIAGGFVEASESFIVHLDTVLHAGTGVMYEGGSVQIISPSLPMTVHAGDTVTVVFRVTPASMDSTIYGGLYYGYIPLYLSGCYDLLSFEGYVTDSTNSNLQLFPDETGLMALTSTTSTVVDTFWFDNNYSSQVIVSNVQLSEGTNFHILGELPHSPNDTLTTGNKMGVIIQFDADTNGFYHDSLIVTTDVSETHKKIVINGNIPQRQVFNLEAIRTQGSAAGVMQTYPISPVNLSLSPNPSGGLVAIALADAREAKIEIFDLLGNRLTSFDNSTSHTWDASGQPNGVYFVRASGMDSNGSQFTISQRLVLAR